MKDTTNVACVVLITAALIVLWCVGVAIAAGVMTWWQL